MIMRESVGPFLDYVKEGTVLALAALARAVAARTGRGLLGGGGRRALAGSAAGTGAGLGIGSLFGGDEDKPKRRRRKRVLTQSDRADIAFVVATLGAPAGKSFAMIVAARA